MTNSGSLCEGGLLTENFAGAWFVTLIAWTATGHDLENIQPLINRDAVDQLATFINERAAEMNTFTQKAVKNLPEHHNHGVLVVPRTDRGYHHAVESDWNLGK
jgi:hypothetical protein